MARAQKLSAGEVLERALHPTLDALVVTSGDPTGTGTTTVALNTSQVNDLDAASNASTSKAANAAGTTIYFRTMPMLYNGSGWDRFRTPSVFKTFTITASNAETTIWTPAASRRFRLMGLFLFSDTATALTFRDNTGGTIILLGGVAANSQLTPPALGNGIASAAINNLLTLQCGTAATVRGTVFGTEEV